MTLFCCRSVGSSDVARALHTAYDHILVGEDSDVVIFEVTGFDLLVEPDIGDVNRNIVGKVLHKSADTQFTGNLIEFSTLLGADCMAGNDDGDLYCDGLLLIDGEEIHVEAVVFHRMPLKLVENCGIGLAIVKREVDDVSLGCVGHSLEFLLVNSEKYVLDTVAVKIAGDKTLTAECLEDGLVTYLTDLSFQFEMLHY